MSFYSKNKLICKRLLRLVAIEFCRKYKVIQCNQTQNDKSSDMSRHIAPYIYQICLPEEFFKETKIRAVC